MRAAVPVFPTAWRAEVVVISNGCQLVSNALIQLILLSHSALRERLRNDIGNVAQYSICNHVDKHMISYVFKHMQLDWNNAKSSNSLWKLNGKKHIFHQLLNNIWEVNWSHSNRCRVRTIDLTSRLTVTSISLQSLPPSQIPDMHFYFRRIF